jgi:hypothetical protein
MRSVNYSEPAASALGRKDARPRRFFANFRIRERIAALLINMRKRFAMTTSMSFKIASATLLVLAFAGCNHSSSAKKTSSDASDVGLGKSDGNVNDSADSATVADVTTVAKPDVVSAAETSEVVPSQPDAATSIADTATASADLAGPALDSTKVDEKPSQPDSAVDVDQEPDASPDIPIVPPPADAADVSPNKADTSKKDTAPVIVDAAADATTIDGRLAAEPVPTCRGAEPDARPCLHDRQFAIHGGQASETEGAIPRTDRCLEGSRRWHLARSAPRDHR